MHCLQFTSNLSHYPQTVGGILPQRDFCPAYTTTVRYDMGSEVLTMDCTDSKLGNSLVSMRGEVFGENSRCIAHASGPRPQCLKVLCNEQGEDKGKVVLVVEGGETVTCTNTGDIVQLPSDIKVICPSFEQVCPE
mgnify:CR=1 FL=1